MSEKMKCGKVNVRLRLFHIRDTSNCYFSLQIVYDIL